MWYIILGYLLVSAPVAILLWLVLIAAKRKDERDPVDSSEECEDRETYKIANKVLLMDFTNPKQPRK
jgi:hypothetical protein